MLEAAVRRPRDRDELVDRMRGGFEGAGSSICPPTVDYRREFQARAAEELAQLPEASAIAEMMSDYSVMWEQASVCGLLSD